MGAPAWLTVLVALVSSGGGVAVGWPPNASTGSTAPWDSTTTHREDRQCDIPSERSHMADDIITSVVAGLLIAAISAIAAGLWHQLKNLRSQIADEETRRSEHEQLMADMRRGCEHEKTRRRGAAHAAAVQARTAAGHDGARPPRRRRQ